jgi:2-methylisocitrate lyase-like PEP mutase family enzyme
MRTIGRTFHQPLLANMVEKGRTPVLSKADLEALNFKLAIFPVTALLAGVQAMTQVYQHFKSTGSSVGGKSDLYDFTDLTKLMGFEEVWAFDKKHAD